MPSAADDAEEYALPLATLLMSHPETANDYLEFRLITEGMAGQLAAERADDKDRKNITEAFEALVKAYDSVDGNVEYEADGAFHLAIYAACRNDVMEQVMRSIFVMLHQDVFYDREHFRGGGGVRELLLRQHKAIYEAIMAGDPEAARSTAENHVRYIRDTLLESWVAGHRMEVAQRRLSHAGLAQAGEVE